MKIKASGLDSNGLTRYSAQIRKEGKMRSLFHMMLLSTALTLTGCTDSTQVFSSSPAGATKQSPANSAVNATGYYKIGNPYQVAGVWYYPKEDYSYKEIGVASWYGPDFHNGITANGEMYDMHALTAAHRTLPLPSFVRVTNLQNGRSLVLRVNDRGPFVNNRVIDVSMRAAQMLGFKEQGTTQVQVEILPEESKEIKEKLLAVAGQITLTAPKSLNGNLNNSQDSYSPDYPRLANPPAINNASALPLVSAAATTKETAYNDWDDDLPKAQAQKNAYEVQPAAKKEQPKQLPKPAPAKPAVKKETSVSVASNVTPGYYVQVGAFGSIENAEKMRTNVSRFGNTVIQKIKTANGKTLYRVRLGPDSAKKALEIMDNLSKNGFPDARLVEEKEKQAAGKRLDNTF